MKFDQVEALVKARSKYPVARSRRFKGNLIFELVAKTPDGGHACCSLALPELDMKYAAFPAVLVEGKTDEACAALERYVASFEKPKLEWDTMVWGA